MRALYVLVGLILFFSNPLSAQTNGDYRSATSGPWNQASTWEIFDGVSWNPAVSTPTSADGAILIVDFTTVDITSSVTVDQVTVSNDAVLNVQSGVLTVANGVGDDLVVTQGDGFFTNDGFFNVLGGATVSNAGFINSTLTNMTVVGTVQHAQNGGIVPNAIWDTGSLLEITGITTTAPTGFTGQTFYDFKWNCASQTVTVVLAGQVTAVNNNMDIVATGSGATIAVSLTSVATGSFSPLTIGGSLTISGTGALAVAPNTGNTLYQISIGGDLTIGSNNTKTSPLNIAGASGATGSQVSITVAGNFIKNNTNNVSMANSAGINQAVSTTIEVNGNFTWNGGTLTMANGTQAANTCVGQLNIGGDLTINAGGFTETSTSSNGRGEIIFDDSHTHNFNSSAATPFANTVNFTVPSSNKLFIDASAFLSGIGGLTLNAGATLGIASTAGISQGTGTGNIRVPAAGRQYIANSNIIYNGTSSQNLGDEWGTGGKLNNVAVNLEISNSGGVVNNITPSTNLVGDLTLTNGAFDIGGGNTLTIQAAFTSSGGTITGHTNSNLSFSGSGNFTGTLSFTSGARTLNNFTIDRNSTIILGSDLTINTTGALIFNAGGNLDLNGNLLTINGDITKPGNGGITSSNTASSLSIAGSGTLTSLPLCGSCGSNLFNTVTLARSGAATYTWSNSALVSGTFALNSGTLVHSAGLKMDTNSTFVRAGSTTLTVVADIAATSTYNVNYTGDLTTGAELPTITNNTLNNLSVAGTVALDKSIKINGNVSVTSGTLNAGSNNITLLGTTFDVSGGSFLINSNRTVTFARTGTTSLQGSTIGGSTFGNFVINSGTTVSAPNANINIAGSWTNGGTFTPNTGKVTFNGGTQSINANGQPFWDLSTDTGTKTLTGNLDVNGTLEIKSGSTLAASTFTIFVAGNWDNSHGGTFTPGSGTVAFDGGTQSIDGSGQAFNNVTFATNGTTKTLANALDVDGALTINSGVTLDVSSANNYAVSVGGNWVNNGTFLPNIGTVTFDGAVIQTVGGTTNTQFYNITQANPSTLTMSSPQSLVNALTLTQTTSVFNPNGNFTMKSTASGDAYISQLPSGASISATPMTIERWLPNNAGVKDFRYLASPVTDAKVAGWKDDFPITGPFSDHSTTAEWPSLPSFNATGFSINIYNESHTPTATVDDRYEGYPAATSTLAAANLVNGTGYAVLVRQTTAIPIELVGKAAFGSVPVTVTDQSASVNDGWNLIGNPYPAPINWENVTRPAGVAAQIALKDNTNTIGLGAGQYIYYTQGGVGIPTTYHGTIAQGQAFFVRKLTAGSAVLTFQEDDKQAVSAPSFLREMAVTNLLRIHVAGNAQQDELVIGFDDRAKDIAEDYDAFKLPNTYINFGSRSSDGQMLAINTMGSLTCSRAIPLILTTVTPGDHTFTFSQVESFADGVDLALLDNFTGETFAVSKDQLVYNFQVTSDANSFGEDRFKILIGFRNVDLGLAVQAQDVCTGSDAKITIVAPQTGVTYFATLNGTTISNDVVANGSSDVTLSIPGTNLTGDTNRIVLLAKNNGCDALPLTQSALINVKSVPAISHVNEGSNCGQGSVILTAVGAPTDGSYKWYASADAIDAIEGQTASSYSTPALTKTKTFFVSAVNSLGCEGARTAVTATIVYTEAPTITATGNVLKSSSETGNQWYLNGEVINGATGQSFEAVETGLYKLVVTVGSCMNQIEQEFTITGDVDEAIKGYTVYPNTTTGLINIEAGTTDPVSISVRNLLGVEITRGDLRQEGQGRKAQFDITGQAAGVYLVIIHHGENTVVKRIVKN